MKTEVSADNRSKKYKACESDGTLVKVNQADGIVCGRGEGCK